MRTKRCRIFARTRLPFEDAVKIFEGPTLEQLDERFDYSEERWYAIGLVDGRPVTVIYTDRDDDTRRIISAWKAEKHEPKAYFDHLETQD